MRTGLVPVHPVASVPTDLGTFAPPHDYARDVARETALLVDSIGEIARTTGNAQEIVRLAARLSLLVSWEHQSV